jgi:hypothetical protein
MTSVETWIALLSLAGGLAVAHRWLAGPDDGLGDWFGGDGGIGAGE